LLHCGLGSREANGDLVMRDNRVRSVDKIQSSSEQGRLRGILVCELSSVRRVFMCGDESSHFMLGVAMSQSRNIFPFCPFKYLDDHQISDARVEPLFRPDGNLYKAIHICQRLCQKIGISNPSPDIKRRTSDRALALYIQSS
jgi:hypothetical protein